MGNNVPNSFLYMTGHYCIMTNQQLEQLKKQYILQKILSSYFDDKKRKELEILRNRINELQEIV